jgi:hypothetical protein
MLKNNDFKAKELCSRKLWQLVNGGNEGDVSESQLAQAVEELAKRRHYLAELSRAGKLATIDHNC